MRRRGFLQAGLAAVLCYAIKPLPSFGLGQEEMVPRLLRPLAPLANPTEIVFPAASGDWGWVVAAALHRPGLPPEIIRLDNHKAVRLGDRLRLDLLLEEPGRPELLEPKEFYVSLHTDDGKEVSGDGYARQKIWDES